MKTVRFIFEDGGHHSERFEAGLKLSACAAILEAQTGRRVVIATASRKGR